MNTKLFLAVRNRAVGVVLAATTVAILALVPYPTVADDPVTPTDPYCVWCPYPYCCRSCGIDEECVFPCNGCTSSSDPVFVSRDVRDVSGVLRERRDLSAMTYEKLARRLADELAARSQ